ncbi:MAG: hypothetical protein IPH75_08340 [bacterium]|nr:hypothetical protein [bacterium]
MSYDLFFRARIPEQQPTREQIADYFRTRENYSVSDEQALYENESTDVYFVFLFDEVEFEAEDDREFMAEGLLPVIFNLNYFRPHVFALEAEIEISAFLRHFDLLVSDYQHHGMGDGEFSSEGFLRGYSFANEASYEIIGNEPGDGSPLLLLETEKLESIWRWNYECNQFNEQLGPQIFVPHIKFFYVDSRVMSAVIWPDGMNVAIPVVDIIVLHRDRLHSHHSSSHKEKTAFVKFENVLPFLAKYPKRQRSLPYYHLEYDEVPPDLCEFIASAETTIARTRSLVSIDSILNREVFEGRRI